MCSSSRNMDRRTRPSEPRSTLTRPTFGASRPWCEFSPAFQSLPAGGRDANTPCISGWNRIAHSVVGNKLATDVVASAKFYAQLNYALANAALAAWATKYAYSTWRPVTAIQRQDIWLPSGRNVSDPSWTPLLRPTPPHPDYVSGHSTSGGAASAVIREWNGGDKADFVYSSNVTLDNRGLITRRYTSLRAAAEENSKSRVYGGVRVSLSFPILFPSR